MRSLLTIISNCLERKRKVEKLEEYGYFKTLSGDWRDNHLQFISRKALREMTYHELCKILER